MRTEHIYYNDKFMLRFGKSLDMIFELLINDDVLCYENILIFWANELHILASNFDVNDVDKYKKCLDIILCERNKILEKIYETRSADNIANIIKHAIVTYINDYNVCFDEAHFNIIPCTKYHELFNQRK